MHSRGIPNARAFRTGRLMVVLIAILATIFGTAVPAFASPTPVAATSTSAVQALAGGPVKTSLVGFSAGNIISDAVFTDKSTMTESQIQAFFNSKVKTCRGGYDDYGPIICLKDFKITSVNRPADKYCPGGYTGAANESAARIIYRVAQACNINPQVLIVMLQKEQSLVTHTWPSAWRYDKALGQGCPDGGVACDPKFVGFFHQIYGAARRMHQYMEDSYFNWYPAGKTSNLLWHPPFEVSPGVWRDLCGSSPVYIANKATSALYYYTPYQPNAAALRAGYGEGDGCSSYGNRNFYNYFTDWFGSTQVPLKPTPVPPAPKISSFDKDAYVVALDNAGGIWAYPFNGGAWGERKQLANIPGATRALMVGDLDRDGHRDLIVSKAADTFLLRGDGAGGFSSPSKLNVDWSAAKDVVVAGDFNRDGVPDMFTTNTPGKLLLWPGDGRGGFGAPREVGSGWSTYRLLQGGIDVDANGVPDLYARASDGRLLLYPGASALRWLTTKQVGSGFGIVETLGQVGDVDRDGRQDLLARMPGGSMRTFLGTGGGSIKTGPDTGSGWSIMLTITGAGPVAAPVSKPVVHAGAGDVDRDGTRDVLGLSNAGELLLYRGSGTGGWLEKKSLATDWSASDKLLTMGDFTGDGIPDLGRIQADGTLWLYPGSRGGGYAVAVRIGNGWNIFDAVVGGVDFDGDKAMDVLARKKDGELRLYRGDGRGGWLADRRAVGSGWGVADLLWNAGDFDGDGRADVMMRRKDGTLWIYPTTGRGTWGSYRQVAQGWGGVTAVVAPGDFTGDGRADLLARQSNGDLSLYAGDGRGGWTEPTVIGWGWDMFSQLG